MLGHNRVRPDEKHHTTVKLRFFSESRDPLSAPAGYQLRAQVSLSPTATIK